jgi:hypothetical protein
VEITLWFGTWFSTKIPLPLRFIAEYKALQKMGEPDAKLCKKKKPTPLLGFLIIQYGVIPALNTAPPGDRSKGKVYLHAILNICVDEGN